MRDQADEDEKLYAEMQAAAANLPPRQRRKKAAGEDVFVKVPLWWFEQATKVTQTPQAFVCVWLLYLAWKTKKSEFAVPNHMLGKRGVDRHTKYRALVSLEKAGLIKIDRRGGKTLKVTLIGL
jgi:hypothetical protein